MINKTKNPISKKLPAIIQLVKTAGAMIRAEFHRPEGPRGTLHKAIVDTEVEAFLKTNLMRLQPASWLGEETESSLFDGSLTWVIDPHDGTADFMKGLRGSAVSVALLENNTPILGVVYSPTAPDDAGDLITWAKGDNLKRNGKVVNPAGSHDKPIVGLNADAADFALANHVSLKGLRVRTLPSPAYRLALAAVGELDAAMSLVGGLSSWDIAGGHALIIGAGKVIAQRNGSPIDYSQTSFDGVVAGAEALVRGLSSAQMTAHPKSARCPAVPCKRTNLPVSLSRAHGVLLGQLAGDALGSFVEFLEAETIARRHPGGVDSLQDGGTWNLIAGQPTDDSEMALALARSLCAMDRFARDHVANAYVEWRKSRPFDIGMTTSSAISALAQGDPVASDSQANGALMRVSPIGVFASGTPALAAEIARQDASLTHPNEVTVAANAAFAAAVSTGVAGGSKEDMWSSAYANAGQDEGAAIVRGRLLAARTKRPTEFQHQMGWVLTAFQNAFYCLMAEQSLRDAVVGTVACGGDTDTNAAICGALVGALQGRDAVPLQWRNAVLTCRPVVADDIHHPRAKTYWPDDALDLAEALLVAGAAANQDAI
ncbi:inositol monophosphatase family protein [Ruegeria arenilitoris]|uniref:inositol monophosphatase family protein n=1 Tax=Ruegeria arenilitoris TaxID=1173585 RepID=UPI001C981EF0|nr:inositol monophosphatase family protein [Ruegeria arenilitoris]MBY6082072.1 ADP-ribosylglycohydrolase family protein [Ruegeria arenilitoris]